MTFVRCLVASCIISCMTAAIKADNRLFIKDHQRKEFLKDGQPFRFISGEMHYFRVPEAYCKDRLNNIKMAALNAVAFYIEWSSHEPEPGKYHSIESCNLEDLLRQIKDQGLLAIAHPGPYICGERNNGGLPHWLLKHHPTMAYRSSDKDYPVAIASW